MLHLSISEQLDFGTAYLISAVAIISLITGYAKSILKNRSVTLMVGGIPAILYAYLYILLQIEDYALLMGSVGLFGVLCAIMYMTRTIDWYRIHQETLNPHIVKSSDPSRAQQRGGSNIHQ
jgi:inner membrane protein